MDYVITIGREYGSGGRFIGKKLAEKLNIPFFDEELINHASIESGLSEDLLKEYDEKLDNMFSTSFMHDFNSETTFSQKVFIATANTIKNLASQSSCVVVGRCADYILKDYENLISIFICAPTEDKINRAVKYYGIDKNKALNIIKKKDTKRKNYYNFYSDKEWGKANSYDICINSKIGIDECVDAIISYLNSKLNK